MKTEYIENLFESQLKLWAFAAHNYAALGNVLTRNIYINGCGVKLQFNPARIASTVAKVDSRSLEERPCFLCERNRPKEQTGIEWGEYTIILNPFPIFPKHLTIPTTAHLPQLIGGRIADMAQLALELPEYTIFYNGPRCGASAPDHMHFQAGSKGVMPIEEYIDATAKAVVMSDDEGCIRLVHSVPESLFLIEAETPVAVARLFDKVYSALPIPPGHDEPMMNIICFTADNQLKLAVIPRKKHRPDCYFAEGEKQILLSPASVDLGGVFIVPIQRDFERITGSDIKQILNEVCMTEEEMIRISEKIRK